MFAKPEIVVDRRSDGTVLLRSSRTLGDFAPSVGSWLDEWAAKTPERIFLASRDFGKLSSIFALLQPKLVFVLGEEADAFGPALRALAEAGFDFDFEVAPVAEMLAEAPSASADVDERAALVGPDTIAKILFGCRERAFADYSERGGASEHRRNNASASATMRWTMEPAGS